LPLKSLVSLICGRPRHLTRQAYLGFLKGRRTITTPAPGCPKRHQYSRQREKGKAQHNGFVHQIVQQGQLRQSGLNKTLGIDGLGAVFQHKYHAYHRRARKRHTTDTSSGLAVSHVVIQVITGGQHQKTNNGQKLGGEINIEQIQSIENHKLEQSELKEGKFSRVSLPVAATRTKRED